MFRKRGRHSAARHHHKKNTFAVSTLIGAIFGSAFSPALATPEETRTADLELKPNQPTSVFDVHAQPADFSLGNLTVETKAAPTVTEFIQIDNDLDAPEVVEPPVEQVPNVVEQPVEQVTNVVEQPVEQPTNIGHSVVATARQYVGSPYVWGGQTPNGWDCVGFAAYVYSQYGVHIPRSSSAARYVGTPVPASEARPGDLMWWPGHVGIYTGNGQHIAAWNPSMGTQEGKVWGSPIYLRVLP